MASSFNSQLFLISILISSFTNGFFRFPDLWAFMDSGHGARAQAEAPRSLDGGGAGAAAQQAARPASVRLRWGAACCVRRGRVYHRWLVLDFTHSC